MKITSSSKEAIMPDIIFGPKGFGDNNSTPRTQILNKNAIFGQPSKVKPKKPGPKWKNGSTFNPGYNFHR